MKVVCFTCDQYSYIIPSFVNIWHKIWPDCPWELEVVTDQVRINIQEKVIYAHAGRHFSDRLIKYMDNYVGEHEHILVMLEDYIIREVNRPLVMRCLDILQQDPNIGLVRLYPKPGPTMPYCDDPDIGEINRHDLYPASLQASIWRSDVFRGVLNPHEDPWQTEEAGSWRARHMPENVRFLATRPCALDYFNYAAKGILDVNVTQWIKETLQ